MHQLVPEFILDNYAAGQLRGAFSAAGLFVDISGFSKMTDTLMQYGGHGAEVMAGVVRTVFEPLIQAVYEQSGFIVVQAGDSFTALFPQESNSAPASYRALAAAWAVHQRSAAQPVHHTPYGEFGVSVKIGLAFGDVNWGIISSESRQRAAYYFSGSAVDGCAEAEHHANPGEIILDKQLYAAVQDLVQVEPADTDYKLLAIHGDLPDPGAVTPPRLDLALAEHFLPRSLLIQAYTGEFRQVTHLFVSLPTVRTETQLTMFMGAIFELQDRYGGLLKLLFGDKGAHLLLIWGAPVAYENDIQRALNFILDLQTRTAIPINGGLTHRMAHAGFIGSELAEEYAAYGRGVNLAARFMTTAPRGELWLDELVAQHTHGQFEIEYLGEKTFKGFAQSQKVYLLLERKEQAELDYPGELVGREAELHTLSEFVLPIFTGQYAGILVVWGEPGAGKTRLVHEFIHHRLPEINTQQTYQVFLAQTDDLLHEAFNPFRYWLRHYFSVSESQGDARNKRNFNRKLDELIAASDEHLAEELDRTRSFLGALVELEWPDSLYEQLDAQGRYENTQIALITLLQAESRQSPVVFFLDDAHWLDEDSKTFLPRLTRALTASEHTHYPIAVLATARFEGSGLPLDTFAYAEIHLSELSRPALARLVEIQLGGQASNVMLDLLMERAQGNPLFAEQILHYLHENKLLVQTENGWAITTSDQTSLPSDIHALLVARLDRLTQAVEEVVQTAAVLGREFEVRLLAEMLMDSALPQKMAQAEQQAIWAALNEIRYIFRHPLMREVAYRMQVQARRQELHALAVTALESLYADDLASHYGELAYHAEQARLPEKALDYLHKAGDAARAAYQNNLAIDYYNRALAWLPKEDLETRYIILLARVAIYGLQAEKDLHQQDLAALEQIAAQLADPIQQAEVAYYQTDYQSKYEDVLEAIAAAEKTTQQALAVGATDIAINAYNLWAMALYRQGKLEAAIQQAETGVLLARQSGSQHNESRMLNTLGLIAIDMKNPTAAQNYFEQSLVILRETNDRLYQALPLNSLGNLYGSLGDYSTAQTYYEQSLALAREIGHRQGEGLVLGNLGWSTLSLGEYENARIYIEQGIHIARQAGSRLGEAYGLINLSLCTCTLGEYANALQNASHGLRLTQEVGDRSGEAWAQICLGHAHAAMGNLDAARDAYQAALDIRRTQDLTVLTLEPLAGLARVALASQDTAKAQRYAWRILTYMNEGGTLEGIDEPLRIYLTCYLVLQAANDPSVRDILNAAYCELQARAACLKDPTKRQTFLENIPSHREIITAWQNCQAKTDPYGS